MNHTILLALICLPGSLIAQHTYKGKDARHWAERLRDENVSVRRQAAIALKQLRSGVENQLPALIESLKDDDSRVVFYVVMAMKNLGPKAKPAFPALLEVVRSESSERGRAAWILGSFGEDGKEAVPFIIPLLKDDNRGIRTNAAIALGFVGPSAEAAIPALIELTRHSDTASARYAIMALG